MMSTPPTMSNASPDGERRRGGLLRACCGVAALSLCGAPTSDARAGSHAVDESPAVSGEVSDEVAGAFGPLGPAGVFTGGATRLEPLTLSLVEPLASAPYVLDSGRYYRIDIDCDGSGELAISGSEFFRAVYLDEVVIEDIEVRPLGLDSLEFDAAGTATISFVAIRPGRYTLSIPGSSGESQRATFTIR